MGIVGMKEGASRWSRRASLMRRIWIGIFVRETSSRRLRRYRSLGPRMAYSLGCMGGRGCLFDMPARQKVLMRIRIRDNGISTYIVGEKIVLLFLLYIRILLSQSIHTYYTF